MLYRFISTRTWTPAAALFSLTLVWFAIRCIHGIHFLVFGDESGHFVGALAIQSGDRLYRDFIDAHGPLVFMVAHLFGVLFGWKEPLNARWTMVGLALIAGGSVITSSALSGRSARLWAGSLFFGLIAAPWLVQALNIVDYYLIGGALVTVILAWLVIPAWIGATVGRYQAMASGLCLALLCANSYSMAPSAVLLAASAATSIFYAALHPQRRAVFTWTLAGSALGGALVLAWLLRYGDLIDYLVFHIIDNQVNFSRYHTFGWHIMVASLVPSMSPYALVQALASIACTAGFLLLLAVGFRLPVRRQLARVVALTFALTAVLMLNFRGANGFQDGSFVVASTAVFALALPITVCALTAPAWTKALLVTTCLGALLCGAELTCRAAVNSPWGLARPEYVQAPRGTLAVDQTSPVFRRVREVLRPDERLLVLVYGPDLFLYAGRLPMRKFHYFLPWDADYAKAPWFGREHNLCVDLAVSPPPVIIYDGWIVGGQWDPKNFIPCLAPLLSKDYVADAASSTLFIRRDRLPIR